MSQAATQARQTQAQRLIDDWVARKGKDRAHKSVKIFALRLEQDCTITDNPGGGQCFEFRDGSKATSSGRGKNFKLVAGR